MERSARRHTGDARRRSSRSPDHPRRNANRGTGGPASVSEVAEPFETSLSAVLQHLRVPETSGLVRSEKVGRIRTCRIEPSALGEVERWIAQRRASWGRRFDRLGEVLAEGSEEREQGEDQPYG
ncbi:MAG: ArsR/SmtB family transcription factor [Gemmatimonadota bacterium]